jgi:hypothetical protein
MDDNEMRARTAEKKMRLRTPLPIRNAIFDPQLANRAGDLPV